MLTMGIDPDSYCLTVRNLYHTANSCLQMFLLLLNEFYSIRNSQLSVKLESVQ